MILGGEGCTQRVRDGFGIAEVAHVLHPLL
jgi:hypothetical protein